MLFGLYLGGNREPSKDFQLGYEQDHMYSEPSNDYFIGTVEMIMERVTLYGTFVGISRLHVSSRQLNGHSLVFVLYQIKCVQNMCTCMYKYLTYSQVVVNMLFTSYLQVVVHIHIDNISIHSI